MSEAIVGGSIVAIVQGIKLLVPQVTGIVTIIIAAVLGLLAGLQGMAGLNWLTGIGVALTGVATVLVASKVSGK